MKTKIFALFAAMMLLMGTTAMAQNDNTKTTETELKGDVNGDGVIDVCDLVGVQNIIDGKAPSCSAADMNSDGKIDALDTAEIIKAIISK